MSETAFINYYIENAMALINENTNTILQLKTQLKVGENIITNLQSQLSEKDRAVSDINEQIHNRDRIIEGLNNEINNFKDKERVLIENINQLKSEIDTITLSRQDIENFEKEKMKYSSSIAQIDNMKSQIIQMKNEVLKKDAVIKTLEDKISDLDKPKTIKTSKKDKKNDTTISIDSMEQDDF